MQPETRVEAELLELGITKTNWGPQESGDRQETQEVWHGGWGCRAGPQVPQNFPQGSVPSFPRAPANTHSSIEPLAQSQRLRVLIHRKASGLIPLEKGRGLSFAASEFKPPPIYVGPGARAQGRVLGPALLNSCC